jgi:pyridoxamine 5'-phosphate oxidase
VTVPIGKLREMLRALDVLPAMLPKFDTASAPGDPVTLFLTWLADAMANKITGPHAMTLSTADGGARVSSRMVLCKDADERGRFYFSSDAMSMKGRELAANPHAAALFYWQQLGRQVRIRGEVATMGREASAADFLARPAVSRAVALVGRQSEPLDDPAELEAAFHRARAEVDADPALVVPNWTLYVLAAETVEFWQASHERRHTRLQYRRTTDGWEKRLLWP